MQKQLRIVLASKNMSQAEFARRAGIRPDHLCRVLRGHVKSRPVISKVAAFIEHGMREVKKDLNKLAA